MGTPITNVRDISSIAYGFIASKALFAALHIDLFGHLCERGKSLAELADETKIPESRLAPLVISLSSLGLLEKQQELYVNGLQANDIWFGMRQRTLVTIIAFR